MTLLLSKKLFIYDYFKNNKLLRTLIFYTIKVGMSFSVEF